MSPTARALAHPRALGYRAQKAQQTVPKTFITRDLFGVDVLALKSSEPVPVIQATIGANHAPCCDKLHREGFCGTVEGGRRGSRNPELGEARIERPPKMWTFRRAIL